MTVRNFSVNQDPDGVYHFQGELSIHELERLKAFLDDALKWGNEIAISLSDVRFIDTAALQLLICFKRHVEPATKFKISSVSGEVDTILTLCGLRKALLT